MFAEAVEELAKLELIDMIRKLGLAHLFAEEMQQTLQVVASSRNRKKNGEAAEELYPTALCFRLMRLHGYKVSQVWYKMLSMASWMRRVICKLAKRNALQSKTNTGSKFGSSTF